MLPKLKPYNKKYDFSYSMGVYPLLDLLKFHGESLLEVVLHSDASKSEGVKQILAYCEEKEIPVITSDKIISKIAYKPNTYAIGVFTKYESSLDPGVPHIVLDQPRNMGNMGTIIRTMVGLGITDIAMIRPAVDIFDPKVVRSSMGAFFQVNFEYFSTFNEYKRKFPQTDTREYYPFMLDGSKDIKEIEFTKTPSIIMGNESKGLAKEYENVGIPVFIPHNDKIDSLNLSVATSIALWEFSKQK
jgi:RNA methyltransferase, TrmH family